ncbi:MAG: hypothetical protein CFE44_21335 [Burkholderiales bacterium PBB4]|nr:MAG: hypothetical protein CFE44_21335 [Burkholderiales bacterium PBB4]
MEAAEIIREAVASVQRLRADTAASPELLKSVQAIKRFQASRFRHTYADLLNSVEFGPATHFFLEELYSDKDFAERDAQFSRIARALQTLFPSQVVQTAVSLAQLHRLTEELDHAMGVAQLQLSKSGKATYAHAWAVVGRRQAREMQLSTVLVVGAELERFTRMTGLRTMLRMMRRPAHAAGLGALQQFLESGFDTFASMSGKKQLALEFLDVIKSREMELIDAIFSNPHIRDADLISNTSIAR